MLKKERARARVLPSLFLPSLPIPVPCTAPFFAWSVFLTPLLKSLLARCPDGAGRAVERDDLVWAMECVLSRAFNGRFGGGQNVSSRVFVASSLGPAATVRASGSRRLSGVVV